MNHAEFTAELWERELYNSQETGWWGANIHQTQILDYLPQLDLTKRNTPCTGQSVNRFNRGDPFSKGKISVLLAE